MMSTANIHHPNNRDVSTGRNARSGVREEPWLCRRSEEHRLGCWEQKLPELTGRNICWDSSSNRRFIPKAGQRSRPSRSHDDKADP